MSDLLNGATALGSAAIALFFLRFWRESADRLFLAFGAAFVAFAGNRVFLGLSERDSEELLGVYSLRLLAFLLIFAAVADRNRR